MTLTDAGALVALLDADDPYHTACMAAAQQLPAGPLLTTWVCFTEAMYLLGTVGGYRVLIIASATFGHSGSQSELLSALFHKWLHAFCRVWRPSGWLTP